MLQAYSFTSAPIAKALLRARHRGVRVEAVLDKSQHTQKYASSTLLVNASIPVWIDSQHAIAHNKVILTTKKILITGRINFTKAAEEKNAENLLVVKANPSLVEVYYQNFSEHKNHAAPLHH